MILALGLAKGNFDKHMTISEEARCEVLWWLENLEHSGKPVRKGQPDWVLFADASNKGWGAHVEEQTAGGLCRDASKVLEL